MTKEYNNNNNNNFIVDSFTVIISECQWFIPFTCQGFIIL